MGTEIDVKGLSYALHAPAVSREALDALDIGWNKTIEGMTQYGIGRVLIAGPLDEGTRGRLVGRSKTLIAALDDKSDKTKAAFVADMLGCYGPPKEGESIAKTVTKFVAELRSEPTWAVALACQSIKTGQAPDISMAHRPTTIQVLVEARRHAERTRTEMRKINAVLTALPAPKQIGEEEAKRIAIKMQGLGPELARRDKANESVRIREIDNRVNKANTDWQTRNTLAEYQRLGIEPRYATGGLLVSPALLKHLGNLDIPKAEKARAKGPARARA